MTLTLSNGSVSLCIAELAEVDAAELHQVNG